MQVIIQHRKHACIAESEKKMENRKEGKDCDYDYDRKIAKKKKRMQENIRE